MKDGCYGYPSAQTKIHWRHCPICLRTWGLLPYKGCPICDTSLKEGEVPKPVFKPYKGE